MNTPEPPSGRPESNDGLVYDAEIRAHYRSAWNTQGLTLLDTDAAEVNCCFGFAANALMRAYNGVETPVIIMLMSEDGPSAFGPLDWSMAASLRQAHTEMEEDEQVHLALQVQDACAGDIALLLVDAREGEAWKEAYHCALDHALQPGWTPKLWNWMTGASEAMDAFTQGVVRQRRQWLGDFLGRPELLGSWSPDEAKRFLLQQWVFTAKVLALNWDKVEALADKLLVEAIAEWPEIAAIFGTVVGQRFGSSTFMEEEP
jgi:hypothetical protein